MREIVKDRVTILPMSEIVKELENILPMRSEGAREDFTDERNCEGTMLSMKEMVKERKKMVSMRKMAMTKMMKPSKTRDSYTENERVFRSAYQCLIVKNVYSSLEKYLNAYINTL